MEVVNLGPLLLNELAAPSSWQHSPPSGPVLLETGLCARRGLVQPSQGHAPRLQVPAGEAGVGARTRVCRGPRGAPESVSEAHFLEGLHGLPVLVVGMGGPGVGMVPTVCPSHFHSNRFFTQNALFVCRPAPFLQFVNWDLISVSR